LFICAADEKSEPIGKESVPIQLAQCWFPGLAISNAKILIYFSDKLYGNNFIKQHSETVIHIVYFAIDSARYASKLPKCLLQFKK